MLKNRDGITNKLYNEKTRIERLTLESSSDWIEMVQAKLVEAIIGMGWKASIEFCDMWLFEKEINNHMVEMRITMMEYTIGTIDSFTDSIWDLYCNFDRYNCIKGDDADSVKDIVREEIKKVNDKCEKVLGEERRKIKLIENLLF